MHWWYSFEFKLARIAQRCFSFVSQEKVEEAREKTVLLSSKRHTLWKTIVYKPLYGLRGAFRVGQGRHVKWKKWKSSKLCQNVGLCELFILCEFHFDRIYSLGERGRCLVCKITSGFLGLLYRSSKIPKFHNKYCTFHQNPFYSKK